MSLFPPAVFYDIVTVVLNLLGMRNGAIVLSIAAVLWLAVCFLLTCTDRNNNTRIETKIFYGAPVTSLCFF